MRTIRKQSSRKTKTKTKQNRKIVRRTRYGGNQNDIVKDLLSKFSVMNDHLNELNNLNENECSIKVLYDILNRIHVNVLNKTTSLDNTSLGCVGYVQVVINDLVIFVTKIVKENKSNQLNDDLVITFKAFINKFMAIYINCIDQFVKSINKQLDNPPS